MNQGQCNVPSPRSLSVSDIMAANMDITYELRNMVRDLHTKIKGPSPQDPSKCAIEGPDSMISALYNHQSILTEARGLLGDIMEAVF